MCLLIIISFYPLMSDALLFQNLSLDESVGCPSISIAEALKNNRAFTFFGNITGLLALLL